MKRIFSITASVIIPLAILLFLNSMIYAGPSEPAGFESSDTIYRGPVQVKGKLTALGPVVVGQGGSISIYNSDGDAVSGLDAYGNITATGRITAAGVNSDNLVRGYDDSQAFLIGSMAAPTVTVTGTVVVATGPYAFRSGACSLAMVPTTTIAFCALQMNAGGDVDVTVYQSDWSVATLPAVLTWFAWVEGE